MGLRLQFIRETEEKAVSNSIDRFDSRTISREAMIQIQIDINLHFVGVVFLNFLHHIYV